MRSDVDSLISRRTSPALVARTQARNAHPGRRCRYSSGMSIPVLDAAYGWTSLHPEAKLERLLAAAGEVFAREGLDAPMPAVAAAAGAGIGSVYRQFSSKHDLLAALVVERLKDTEDGADAALASIDGPWVALTGLLWTLAERQAGDDVL